MGEACPSPTHASLVPQGRLVLSNKMARTIGFFYTLFLHCLVFLVSVQAWPGMHSPRSPHLPPGTASALGYFSPHQGPHPTLGTTSPPIRLFGQGSSPADSTQGPVPEGLGRGKGRCGRLTGGKTGLIDSTEGQPGGLHREGTS